MSKQEVTTEEKRKVKQYSTVGKNGIKLTVSFTDDKEEDKKSREIIKDFIIKEIL